MILKIYVNEKPIILADKDNNRLQHKIDDGFLFFDGNTNVDFSKIVNDLKNGETKGVVILQKELNELKKSFFDSFEIIEAAGGIVLNELKELLFIYRNGKWDIPKGKLETGETVEYCAKREVEEETGVSNLNFKRKIGETYHIYTEKGKNILKVCYWFYFTCDGVHNIAAQEEEGITEVKWIATKDIKKPMENTYENIKNILSTFFDTP
jgi:8-oxo-dGTP pyrophosphatase MutT (NUDIX family)